MGHAANRHNVVMRVVQAGPEQIVHGRIHNDKLFRPRLFRIEHPRQQNAGVAHDHPPGLQNDFTAGLPKERQDRFRKCPGMRGGFVRIGNPKPATDVEVLHRQALGVQGLNEDDDLLQ